MSSPAPPRSGWSSGDSFPESFVASAEKEPDAPAEVACATDGFERPAPSPLRLLRTVAVWLAVWLVPVVVLCACADLENIFAAQAVFFSKAAAVTFGGAYAVLAYVAQQAVDVRGWLSSGEMLTGLGFAETTPGPLIIVLQFVGYMGAYNRPAHSLRRSPACWVRSSRSGRPSSRVSCGFSPGRLLWRNCAAGRRLPGLSRASPPPWSA